MEVLLLPTGGGRVFALEVEEGRVTDGVPVRGVVVPVVVPDVAADPSCFVGDLVGDYANRFLEPNNLVG